MNGAESLLRSLVASGVDVCFANPGTSEMHFVAALDRVQQMRPVLALEENVVTGAADGFGRMARKPACTLLHLGPGLANGLANLHNARRAGSPIVNVVGDHAAAHLRYDAPLTSDIAGFARPVSDWIRSSPSARDVGSDVAMAVKVAREHPGRIATLILPADTAWGEADGVANTLLPTPAASVAGSTIDRVVELLKKGRKAALLMRGEALSEPGLIAAGKIATKTGARLMCDTFTPRLRRGAGHVAVERLPYFSEHVVEFLAGTELIVLVGSKPPVSFFAYPDKMSWLTPEGCRLVVLAQPHEDGAASLEALAEDLGAARERLLVAAHEPPVFKSAGQLAPDFIMATVARHLPENAIIADEAATSGFPYYGMTATAAAHDYLNLTGGSVGSMMAVAIGAAVACPGRKVVTLQGDGNGMYSLQSLWTQAREKLDIVTIVYANRSYKILTNELKRVGAVTGGDRAASLMSLHNPSIDWVKLAEGMGVSAVRADTCGSFEGAFVQAMRGKGPLLIEAVIP